LISTLTIVRYPRFLGWAGFLSMGFFRIPLFFNRQINFWKLLGCGKNGTFDIYPNWRQWGILTVINKSSLINEMIDTGEEPNNKFLYGNFIRVWWKFFRCETYTIFLEPIEGHGLWDGKEKFGSLPKETSYNGKIAVLTRATIRINRLKHFWKHVDAVSTQMRNANGFVFSVGIGELPWIKQSTFSVWESKEKMKQFAYKIKEHTDVIRKTRKENWYSEDMFVRFKVIKSFGTVQGVDLLKNETGINSIDD
jgi:hypothetical protein